MIIFVGTSPPYSNEPTVVLMKDNWNDWFKWYTMYSALVILGDGRKIDLGGVKVAHTGMTEQSGSTQLPQSFTELDESYFSLGQSENYYETLTSLGDELRETYLRAMRDCAYSHEAFAHHLNERVMRESLLRDIQSSRVGDRLRRLAHGQSVLTAYSFEYEMPTTPLALTPAPRLSFAVSPNSLPATNIHVIIGRNGVGKTRCFDLLARAFLGMAAADQQQTVGYLRNTASNPFMGGDDLGFAGLVAVSFSAFDSKGPLTGATSDEKCYDYIGLVTHKPPYDDVSQKVFGDPRIKGLDELAQEFAQSVIACRKGVRRKRWKDALSVLEADPLFAEANISALAEDSEPQPDERARLLFKRLSSGHAVVLLSITRLVELVQEKSLILIDEPESHLHPPLLSAFVRALSDLLTNRNGVAIVATHSPVVLQEVPASCVWKLSRTGHDTRADRPEQETFGENVGVLTREVFGLEVTQTGFHQLIAEKAQSGSYEDVLAAFNQQLGAEGRALARALTLIPPQQTSDDKDD